MATAKELIAKLTEARSDYSDPHWVARELESDWQSAAMDIAMGMGEDPDSVHGDADYFSDWVGDQIHDYFIMSKKQLDVQAVIDELETSFKWMRGANRIFQRLRRSF